MPEAELARVDECDRSIPRRETIRGTHWQKTPLGCLDLASRNPSRQRSCATATTDRTYDRKRSDSHEQTLATRGPSTYGSRLCGRDTRDSVLDPVAMQIVAVGIEPGLGAVDMAADLAHHAPEPRRVVHLDQMRHFVGGEIVEHKGRREDQAPGE